MRKVNQGNRIIITIKSACLSFLSTVALHLELDKHSLLELQETSQIENMHAWFRLLWDIKLSISGHSLEALILFISLSFLFAYSLRLDAAKRLKIVAIVLAALYSFFYVFGESFKRYENWSGVFGSLRNLFKAGIKYAGAFVLAYTVIIVLFTLIESNKDQSTVNNRRSLLNMKPGILFLVFFAIIIVCWLPYAWAYCPGLTNYDFFDMLDTFYGNDTNSLRVVIPISDTVTLNNNNPVLQVLMAVATMKIGEALGSPYYGIALFCYTQMILFAAILSYSLLYMKKRGVPHGLIWAALLIYGLLPWNPNFALTTLKDTNYSFVTLLFTLLLADMVLCTDEFFADKKEMIAAGSLMLLMMLLRNNGVYVLILLTVILLIVLRRHIKKVALITLIPIFIYMVAFTRFLYPALGIAPGSRAEMYSLPIQQIARVIKEEGDNIEYQDQQAISKVLNNYDEIAERYNPELADPVKSRFNKYATAEDINGFVKVWVKYLKKYPGIYIQAAICDCYGYFYPEAEHWLVYTKIEPPGEAYGVISPKNRSTARMEMNQMAYIVNSLPGVGMLMSVGFYSWVMFASIGYLVYSKKKEKIVLWLPGLILLLTVLAGPANTMPRYIYPIIISTPLLVSITVTNRMVDEQQL